MELLEKARLEASPRYTVVPTPYTSLVIHGVVFILWIVTFVFAFGLGGLFAWSTGVVYVLYDTLLLLFVFAKTLKLLAPPRVEVAGTACTVCVVIAAHNESIVLPATLGALLGQDDPPDEIVVADDGSTDGTDSLLSGRYGLVEAPLGQLSAPSPTHPSLRWLRLVHQGKGHALNAALVQTTMDMIVTVDGDTLLDPGALAAMRRSFAAEPDLVAATGVLFPVCSDSVEGSLFQWFQNYEYIRNFLSRYAWMRLDSLLLISGAFAGFRRSPVIAVGGFDPDCLVEDYELIHRLRRFGTLHGLSWKTRVLGAARARTEAPGTLATFLRQRRRWFGGFLQTQYWYRDMVGDRRYGWLGTAMLPIKAFDTFQPLYGLTALFVLLAYCLSGRVSVLLPVGTLILSKLALDLAFHLWCVHLYRVWTGKRSSSNFGFALLAAIAEPFSFQILRHVGAAWGWIVFVTGRKAWGEQKRVGLSAVDERE